jgi:hypothetical protein
MTGDWIWPAAGFALAAIALASRLMLDQLDQLDQLEGELMSILRAVA